jgi:hypothetical protein
MRTIMFLKYLIADLEFHVMNKDTITLNLISKDKGGVH